MEGRELASLGAGGKLDAAEHPVAACVAAVDGWRTELWAVVRRVASGASTAALGVACVAAAVLADEPVLAVLRAMNGETGDFESLS